MAKEVRDLPIECPRCRGKAYLPKWKLKHKTGQLAEVACPSCGWRPVGEALATFRGALAVLALQKDLRKKKWLGLAKL